MRDVSQAGDDSIFAHGIDGGGVKIIGIVFLKAFKHLLDSV